MKWLLILLSCLMLSGCMTPNLEWETLQNELDTPLKIATWMKENITYEAHIYIELTPYQLFNTLKGDCSDMANFGEYIAEINGYTTYHIIIRYSDTFMKHMLTVYDEGLYSFTTNYDYHYGYNSFLDVVLADDHSNKYNWEAYKVYDDEGIIERGIRCY